MTTPPRTYAVSAAEHPTIDNWVTDSAYAAGWGLDHEKSRDLPPYHGVWEAQVLTPELLQRLLDGLRRLGTGATP